MVNRIGDPNDPQWIAYMKKRNVEIKKEEDDKKEIVIIANWGSIDKYEKRMKLHKDEMNKRKQKIVKEYGTDPTICYFHYLYNAVNYIGEKNLRIYENNS